MSELVSPRDRSFPAGEEGGDDIQQYCTEADPCIIKAIIPLENSRFLMTKLYRENNRSTTTGSAILHNANSQNRHSANEQRLPLTNYFSYSPTDSVLNFL